MSLNYASISMNLKKKSFLHSKNSQAQIVG